MSRDYPRLPALARAAIVALSAFVGVLIGFVTTFVHQSTPPIGVVIALATVTVYLAGLRLWALSRGPVFGGAFGIALTGSLLALPGAGANVLVPGNVIGYTWTFGVVVIALVIIAWPHIERTNRPNAQSAPTSMEAHLEKKEPSTP